MDRKIAVTVLVFLVGIAYWNALPGQFHYDDYPLLLENSKINGERFDPSLLLYQYGGRPLTLWSFHLNYRMFGESPGPYLLVNLLLHLAFVFLLFFWLERNSSTAMAFLTAALVSVHPLQAQAVNYIWARSVLLMSVFLMGAFILARSKPGLSFLLFQLAIWSRAEALVAVIVLGLLNRVLRGPLAVLACLNLVCLAYGLQLADPPAIAWNYNGILNYWFGAPWHLLNYLKMMTWPAGYSIFHWIEPVSLQMNLLLWLVILAIAFILFRTRSGAVPMVIGWCWTFLFLLPSLLIPSEEPVSDARAYLAVVGFAFSLSWILLGLPSSKLDLEGKRILLLNPAKSGRMPGRFRSGLLLATGLVVVGFLVTATWERNRIWSSDVAVWEEAAAVSGESDKVRYNLAAALSRKGEIDRAEEEFRAAIQLNPHDDMSYAGLGYCSERRGSLEQSLDDYQRALNMNPANQYALDGMKRVMIQMTNREERP